MGEVADQRLRSLDLPTLRLHIRLPRHQPCMSERMIADPMSGIMRADHAGAVRLAVRDLAADHEERRPHVVRGQDVEHRVRDAGCRSVVERQRQPLHVCGASPTSRSIIAPAVPR